MTKFQFTVKGMHCKSCSMIVTENLQDLGAKDVSIKLDEKKQIAQVSFDFSGKKEDAVHAIEKEGYKVQ